MAHQFTVNATIHGVSLDEFKKIAQDTALHEAVSRRLPTHDLEIIESSIKGDIYTMRRAYGLDVNIPDVARKFLKNAFRLTRTDVTNLKDLSSKLDLATNLPLEAQADRTVSGNNEKIDIQLLWTVKVKVPLIAGMLEKHAETEVRRFSKLEIDIVEDELKKHLNK